MFDTLLIANRGAIAVRIMRTLGVMGIRTIAVYAESDRDSLHVAAADTALCLGAGDARDTYLDQNKLFDAIAQSGAQAVHPGYGFLSENAGFAEALAQRGIAFVGPRPEHLRTFGLKHEAREVAVAAGVNLLPGSGLLADIGTARREADAVGYPVMLKSTAGGGGIGMQRCATPAELDVAFTQVQRLAASSFGNAEVFLEKVVTEARHVEVQVFGDGRGGVITVGDRDCSLQRRHQKVIEECPAPNLPDRVRADLHDQTRALLQRVAYENAGTVEFLYDASAEQFFFLEVNTRLQVEHGVTELTYGVDLVRWMVEQAAGTLRPLAELAPDAPDGHAIEARVYAEDPLHDFRPTPGEVSHVQFAEGDDIRVDTWLQSGVTVPSFFDPLLANLMVRADTRSAAIDALDGALAASAVAGIETNLGYLRQTLASPAFRSGAMSTATLASIGPRADTFEVLVGGAGTMVQSYPGRQGYWAVGVPPSGPMDDLSFRIGNRLLGNPADASGLEMVLHGPRLLFNVEVWCALTGADCQAELDGTPVPGWQAFRVSRGQTLDLGGLHNGMRAYLTVAGGIQVPEHMGSSATFALGRLGGFNGRALRTGDTLHLAPPSEVTPQQLAPASRPELASRSVVRVLMGPHVAPDFFTEDDISTFLASEWSVHYNSSRTGVRLTGPQPHWARSDGGEAGLHPSNIHDNAYAFGSIDFTGDMPVILGPDGPSLGGFVCPAVVINADRWKLGQLTPGDKLRFEPVSEAQARRAEQATGAYLETLDAWPGMQPVGTVEPAVLQSRFMPDNRDDVMIRRAGQEWLLVEFGPAVLDIELRLKVHVFAAQLERERAPGIVEMTPGVRSLQIRFDTARWTAEQLARWLLSRLDVIENVGTSTVASRIVHLPLSWDDPACREAIGRYQQGVRDDAPWCPDNIEFIRRINGLASRQTVKDIVFDARYLVLGLGDVYLGAPVATPLDPRHRLVTTKYNPARTWTAENSVGIGGSYLCIYGMEGPGGYQFVGRTLQVWNKHRRGPAFDEHWLLRPFDQIQFYEVSAETLLDMREAFPRGELTIEIEHTQYNHAQHQQFLHDNADDIDVFTRQRSAAFNAELVRWREQGLLTYQAQAREPAKTAVDALAAGAEVVASPMAGSVWSVRVASASQVQKDDVVLVIEAMKAEFEVRAPSAGTIDVVVAEGQLVDPGQTLAVIEA